MKIIAVTGGIGSGKSTVSKMFNALGAEVISCDEISHRIMRSGESAYAECVAEFGKNILGCDGEIDRGILAGIVFSDAAKLGRLNDITHRLIYKEIQRLIDKSDADIICVEIPLLFNSETPLEIDAKIAVIAPIEKRVERVMQRDKATEEAVMARIANQLSDDEMRRRADFVIENNGSTEELEKQVRALYKTFI